MKRIINGRILLPDGEVFGKELWFDEKILGLRDPGSEEACETIDAGGAYVGPGLVDLHIHGYLGHDVSDGSREGTLAIGRGILQNGVTAWCPTTMTVPMAEIEAALNVCRRLRQEQRPDAAEILGVHAEGPFINPAKKGAQAEESILPADAEFVRKNQDILRLITVAPEASAEGMDFIRTVTRQTDVIVSLGHTTADYDTAKAAFRAGARHVTHLFNAMTGLEHRAPGTAGAALTEEPVSCELIADGFHVHPGLFEMLYRLKQDKLVLITDCIRAGGLSDGEYTLGGQNVTVRGVQCRLRDGTIAGSVLTLNRAVYNLHRFGQIPLYQAVAAASLAPARVLGEEERIGSLCPGREANILIADDRFAIQAVFRKGARVV